MGALQAALSVLQSKDGHVKIVLAARHIPYPSSETPSQPDDPQNILFSVDRLYRVDYNKQRLSSALAF